MNLLNLKIVDEVFFVACLENTGEGGALIVEGEMIPLSMQLELTTARWGDSGNDAIDFIARNSEKVSEIIISHL